MRQKNDKVNTLKSWIVNTFPGGRERLTKAHQSIKKDLADHRKDEQSWY